VWNVTGVTRCTVLEPPSTGRERPSVSSATARPPSLLSRPAWTLVASPRGRQTCRCEWSFRPRLVIRGHGMV
jgi:hypothetical protein